MFSGSSAGCASSSCRHGRAICLSSAMMPSRRRSPAARRRRGVHCSRAPWPDPRQPCRCRGPGPRGPARASHRRVDRGHGHPVTEPGLDVLGIVEAALGLLLDLLEDPLADVVVGVEAELVLDRRELVEGLERLDLLRSTRVEVDRGVADGELGRASSGWAPVARNDMAAQAPTPTTARTATVAPIRMNRLPRPPNAAGFASGSIGDPPPASRYSVLGGWAGCCTAGANGSDGWPGKGGWPPAGGVVSDTGSPMVGRRSRRGRR